jgi:hypothetical protein
VLDGPGGEGWGHVELHHGPGGGAAVGAREEAAVWVIYDPGGGR